MAEPARDAAQWLPAARSGSRKALGEALEACRAYLLVVAQRELDPQLRAKAGASDLVQQTFLEAQRDFPQFQGESEAELLAWLRQVLLNNLSTFTRSYRATEKRRVDREVALDANGPGREQGKAIPVRDNVLTPSGELMEGEQRGHSIGPLQGFQRITGESSHFDTKSNARLRRSRN